MTGHREQPRMPVIRDPKDFDRRSGNLLERVIFNNRVLVLLACLVAGFVAFRRFHPPPRTQARMA